MERIRRSRFFTRRVPTEEFFLGWALMAYGVVGVVAVPLTLLLAR